MEKPEDKCWYYLYTKVHIRLNDPENSDVLENLSTRIEDRITNFLNDPKTWEGFEFELMPTGTSAEFEIMEFD